MTVTTSPRVDAPTADVPRLGTVLGVWAHPDDEAYLSSGLMLHAREAGERVVVVTATDGELGAPSPTTAARRRLAARRRRELAASLGILGVQEHHRLGHPDAGCSAADRSRAVERLAAIIEEVRPDMVVTFGPDGLTGHDDHRTVGSWTVEAAAVAGHAGRLWFPTLTPGFHRRWAVLNDEVGLWMDPAVVPATPEEELSATVSLTGERLALKVAALRAQESQTSALLDRVSEETFAAWWATEWFRAPGPTERARLLADGGRRVDR